MTITHSGKRDLLTWLIPASIPLLLLAKQDWLWRLAHVFYRGFDWSKSHWNQGRNILPRERAILRNWDPRNMKTALNLMNIVRCLLANCFHISNPSGCFCAHRAQSTNSIWVRAGRLPRQDDTWVKCWRMHKSQAGWR